MLLSTAYPDRATLVDGVATGVGEDLLLLVPVDTATDGLWFDVRAADPQVLEEIRATLGGVILDGDDAIEDWLAAND